MKISSRIEYKYPCDHNQADVVRDILLDSPMWRFDPHCSSGNPYWVSSLYWDTQEMVSYSDSINGEYTKAKMRLRAYFSPTHKPFSVIKAEVKSRLDKICDKASLSKTLSEIDLHDFRHCFSEDLHMFFRQRCKSYKMQPLFPVTVVMYERLGFVHLDQKSRLTIDRNIMALPPKLFFQSFEYIQPSQNFQCVVELKDCNLKDAEMEHIARALSTPRQKFSKYCQAVDHLQATKAWVKHEQASVRPFGAKS
ncbi:MAG: VTC domain-containing protein [Bdellovibrionota bacterium]